MEQVFIDTDVVIDFLTERKPFSEDAARIFTYSEKGHIRAMVSALSFSHIFYIIRKLEGGEKAIALLDKLEKIVAILPLDEQIIKQALSSGFPDFEDAIQNFCAKAAGVRTIVTRDISDYAKSDLAIHTPESYLLILKFK